MKSVSPIKQLIPLLLVIFIDSVGLGLIYPILSAVLLEPSSAFFPSPLSEHTRALYFGYVAAIFSLTWFFGSAYISELSDTIGRKPALLICLFGSCLGYVITALGIIGHSLSAIILGRALDGFTAGSQPVAQASAIDLANGQDKTRYLTWVILAMSLGFVCGPIFGGLLSDKHLVSWFSYDMPFFFAALLSALNMFALWFFYKESFVRTVKRRARFLRAITLIKIAICSRPVFHLSLLYCLFIFGWAAVYTFISPFVLEVYHFSGIQIIYLMAVMGVGFVIGNALLVNIIPKSWSRPYLLGVTWLLTALIALAIVLTHNVGILIALVAVIGAMASLGYVYTLELYSDMVSAEHQGLIMGVSAAVVALGFTVIQFVGGFLLKEGPSDPIIFGVMATAIAGILVFFYKKPGVISLKES